MPEFKEIKDAIESKYPHVNVCEQLNVDYGCRKIFAIYEGKPSDGEKFKRYIFFNDILEDGREIGFPMTEPYPDGIIDAAINTYEKGYCGPIGRLLKKK